MVIVRQSKYLILPKTLVCSTSQAFSFDTQIDRVERKYVTGHFVDGYLEFQYFA